MQKAFSTVLVALVMLAGAARSQTFTLTQTFPNPTPANADQFGNAVAAVGNKILVGARNDDTGASNAGAVYLFDGNSSAPLLTIVNPNPATNALFGAAVAAFGNDLLIGAPGANGNSGAVYLCDGSTGALILTIANPSATADQFGFAVTAVGSNILVGAPLNDTGATDAGIAYLFDTNGTLLLTFTNPTPIPATGVADQFGNSLAAVGNNVLIGAPGDDTGATNAGAAYLCDGNTGALLRTFTNPSPTLSDQFGGAVAAVGANVLIGTAFEDAPTTNSGVAYLYDVNLAAPIQTFQNPTPGNTDLFSFSVAAFGNNVLVVIGAPLDDDAGAANAGAAYLYDVNTTSPLQTFLDPLPVVSNDQFGAALAARGNNIIIAAPNKDAGATDAGTVYLFTSNQNQPPVADAGADQTVECASHAGTLITLDGSNSSDPDQDQLTYTWRENGNIIAGPTTDASAQVTLNTGSHTIELTVDDGNGETDTDEVVINVVDTTPPTITLAGDNPMTLECHIDSYAEPGAVASDVCDPNPALTVNGSVNPNVMGSYTITYTATDVHGNSASTTRTVNVVDTTPPTITLNGNNPMTLECHTAYADPGATASDACDPSPTLSSTGSVNPDAGGSYTITYTATDASGNNATMTRTVNVVDTTPPVITLKPAKKLCDANHCYITLTLSQCIASVTDACAGAIAINQAVITSASSDEAENVSGFQDGYTFDDIVIANDCKSVKVRAERNSYRNGRVYTINLQVSDANGNAATAAFKVLVPVSCCYGSNAVDDGPVYTEVSTCSGAPLTKAADRSNETAINEAAEAAAPESYALAQNFPNPFNPATEIRFAVPEVSHVVVKIFNTLGETVRTLVDEEFAAGTYTAHWNAQNDQGQKVPSGMYFYRLVTPNFTETKRMILAK